MYKVLSILKPAVAALALSIFIVTAVYAQQSERAVIERVSAEYPPLLKGKQIGGVVNLAVVVSPSGTVKRTRVLGGNPILAVAAEKAVKLWKYAPSPSETEEFVSLRFDPFSHR